MATRTTHGGRGFVSRFEMVVAQRSPSCPDAGLVTKSLPALTTMLFANGRKAESAGLMAPFDAGTYYVKRPLLVRPRPDLLFLESSLVDSGRVSALLVSVATPATHPPPTLATPQPTNTLPPVETFMNRLSSSHIAAAA